MDIKILDSLGTHDPLANYINVIYSTFVSSCLVNFLMGLSFVAISFSTTLI